MPKNKYQDERDRMRKHIKLLEATLKDTEMILFDTEVEAGLKHRGMVVAQAQFACRELLTKRQRLFEAQKRRPKTW